MKIAIYCLCITIIAVTIFNIVYEVPIPTPARVAYEQAMAPGYSVCHSCGRPWKFVESHETKFTASSACFPLCERCWAKRTPEERLPFYRELWVSWQGDGARTVEWEVIERAVLEGG